MRKQVEMQDSILPILCLCLSRSTVFSHQIRSVKINMAFRRDLQKVQRTQEGRFSASGRTYDHNNLAFTDLLAHTVQGMQTAREYFFQIFGPDQDLSLLVVTVTQPPYQNTNQFGEDR